MRPAILALGLTLLLAGCGDSADMGKTEITLSYSPTQAELAASNAAVQCQLYGKTAKLKGIEKQGDNSVAVYECD